MKNAFEVSWAVAVLVLVSGCNPTAVVCRAGTERCGPGCADFSADTRNCGACGLACAPGQVCDQGMCACQAGTTSCGGQCAVLSSDPSHCGSCGNACPSGQYCAQGACVSACPDGGSPCSFSCVDVQASAQHCGACGRSCQSGQVCVQGRCQHEVVAACFRTGQLVGLTAGDGVKGPLKDVGSGPGALARLGESVLSLDGIDNAMYQAVAAAPGAQVETVLAQRRAYNVTGSVPNQAVVAGDVVYVVNAASGTLQVLRRGAPGGSMGDAGVEGGEILGTVAELPFGANTYPQGAALAGDMLWVPLYGGVGEMEAQAGQRVMRIDVSDPAAPRDAGSVALSTVDLKPFDGGVALPRPWAIVAKGAVLYVVLNNLTTDYRVAGPGVLARIDAMTQAVTSIELGEACLNPQWIAAVGDSLAVSCLGEVRYDERFVATSSRGSGLVLVGADDKVAPGRWSADCVADCSVFLPGRFAVRGDRIFVGDQNSGRLAVVRVEGSSLVPVRGPGAPAEAISVCPAEPGTALANVSDVLAL